VATATSELSARAIAFEEIPVIDIGAMAGGDAAAKLTVARAIREASETVGFFYIRNHGVADADLARTFELGGRFFALPLADKVSLHQRNSPHHAGYTPLLAENTDPANNGDLHESFDMVSRLEGDVNLWPEALPELKEHLNRYFAQVLHLGHRLF